VGEYVVAHLETEMKDPPDQLRQVSAAEKP